MTTNNTHRPMTEQEIIKLLQDVAQGSRPKGDNISPELKQAIIAVYQYGYDAALATVDNVDALIEDARADQREADRQMLYDMEQKHEEEKQDLLQQREQALNLLREAIDLLDPIA